MCVWDNDFISHFICLNSSLLFRFYEYADEATHSAHTQHLHAITQRYLYVFVAAQRNYRRPNTLQWASAHTITATTSSLSSSPFRQSALSAFRLRLKNLHVRPPMAFTSCSVVWACVLFQYATDGSSLSKQICLAA